jgi:hypothetical protein
VRSRPFRGRRAAAALALAVALSGCGEDKQAKDACLQDAYRAAEITAVVRLYEEGKLGTQKQIESELSGPPGEGASFFDAEGHFIPYEELDLAHKNQLIAWMSTGRVGELTFEERERARANANPDC